MRTVFHNGTIYEGCPHCGLSPIGSVVRTPGSACPACRNGKVKPDEVCRYFCGRFRRGPRF